MGRARESSKRAAAERDGAGRTATVAERPYPGMLELQRTAGNHAVTLMLSRLSVGPVGDRFEQEADRLADSIMRMGEPSRAAAPAVADSADPELVRRSASASASGTGLEGGELSPDVEAGVTGALRSGGRPLPKVERTFFESRMGYDFGAVRIHDGPAVAQASRAINARAFTVGSNIAFGEGTYQPGTTSGRRLLAHELTHVVQQGAADLRQD